MHRTTEVFIEDIRYSGPYLLLTGSEGTDDDTVSIRLGSNIDEETFVAEVRRYFQWRNSGTTH